MTSFQPHKQQENTDKISKKSRDPVLGKHNGSKSATQNELYFEQGAFINTISI